MLCVGEVLALLLVLELVVLEDRVDGRLGDPHLVVDRGDEEGRRFGGEEHLQCSGFRVEG